MSFYIFAFLPIKTIMHHILRKKTKNKLQLFKKCAEELNKICFTNKQNFPPLPFSPHIISHFGLLGISFEC